MRKPKSEQHRANLSIDKKGKPTWNIGIPRTSEEKERISNSKAKKWKILFSDGHEEIVSNMNKYCRENDISQPSLHKTSTNSSWYKGLKAVRL